VLVKRCCFGPCLFAVSWSLMAPAPLAMAQSAAVALPTKGVSLEPAVSAAAPLDDAVCAPPCRKGYLCVRGNCVSACNPPCAPDETCTPQAECVAKAKPLNQVQAQQPSSKSSQAWRIDEDDNELGHDAGAASEDDRRNSLSHEGRWLHNGLYLRVALGLGWLWSYASDDTSTYSERHSISGFLLADDLALGGSPIPGLVIGGGVFSASAPAPKDAATASSIVTMVSPSGSPIGQGSVYITANVTTGSISTIQLGPFVDYYPNPKFGFHMLGATGLGILLWGKGTPGRGCADITTGGNTYHDCGPMTVPTKNDNGLGWSGLVGVGFEGFVSEQWSLGGMMRIMYSYGKVSDYTMTAFMPSLMFGATYN
jgi:hypothetical protein